MFKNVLTKIAVCVSLIALWDRCCVTSAQYPYEVKTDKELRYFDGYAKCLSFDLPKYGSGTLRIYFPPGPRYTPETVYKIVYESVREKWIECGISEERAEAVAVAHATYAWKDLLKQ